MAVSDRADLTQKQNDNELLRRELVRQRHEENQIGAPKRDELDRLVAQRLAHNADPDTRHGGLTQKNEPGVKFDAGKPRLDLIPFDALNDIGLVLDYGAKKYGERNWERGMSWGHCFGALLRHLGAYWAGEDLDVESKLPHLAHAGCCLLFLSAYRIRKAGTDDRR